MPQKTPGPRSASIRLAAGLLAALWFTSLAAAQPVLITAPTTVSATDTTITSTAGGSPVLLSTAQITVSGTTLTINGRHTVGTLTLERSGGAPGILTHTANFTYDYSGNGSDVVAGMDLTVAGSLDIQGASGQLVASRIDVSGAGYPQTQGPGAGTSSANGGCGSAGGSYGGTGGAVLDCGYLGGATYGSFSQPALFGSGSGVYINGFGASGGGCVRLSAGSLSLGAGAFIAADGASSNSSGGAGGSVWINCFSLSGAGSISANGGDGSNASWGGGGGGRVAVYYTNSTFTGSMQARGGFGSRGGAGTVYVKPAAQQRGTLTIDNVAAPAGESTTVSGLQSINADLVVANFARVGPPRGDSSLHLNIAGDVTVGPNGAIAADARGHLPTQGPGAGTSSANGSCGPAGGSHGGSGGMGNPCGYLAGPTYGSILQPVTMGSGSGTYINGLGASGGGAFRLTAGGTLTVSTSGVISVNGESAFGAAGAGGGLWISCVTLAGDGLISANGGDGVNEAWGGGGGGRIAVYYTTSTFAGSIRAYGGVGARAGAGTVFTKPASSRGTITIDNGGLPFGETTELAGLQSLDANLVVANGAVLGPPRNDASLHLNLAGNVTVAANGVIGAAGHGYPAAQGPGAGEDSLNGGCGSAGGSHGGAGGFGYPCGWRGGPTYGSILQPTTQGSGSGRFIDGIGAAGGGALRLTSGGTLTVASGGLITADGQSFASAAGAGGSLWITCATLAGSGIISANGGNGGNSSWGGGGGGRIAIYYTTSSFTGSIQAFGGNGDRAGAGTIFTKPASSRGTLTVDNGFAPLGQATELSGLQQLDANLRVANYGLLAPPRGDATLHLQLAGNVTVAANGVLGAPARGYPAAQGPGAGEDSTNGGCGSAGGGYGGMGGLGGFCGFAGGATYGSADRPTDMGSGSGRYLDGRGAPGGGALRLSAAGTVDVQSGGLISADSTRLGAGGSGGSLWITCAALHGNGIISADGGDADNSSWGSGGGGRIAIYACLTSMNPANIHAAAGRNGDPAQDGSVIVSAATATVEPEIACYATTVTFRVTTSGQVSSFQWRFNGQAIDDGPLPSGAIVMGATTSTLVITGVTSLEEGDYDCEVPDACGGVTSNTTHLFVTCCPDVNQDGSVDQGDVDYIINVVAGGDNPTGIDPDFNHDGNADQSDVDALINVVAGGGCP